jgi:signal transduction histidine kinase
VANYRLGSRMSEEKDSGTELARHARTLASLRYDSVRVRLMQASIRRFQRARALVMMPALLFAFGVLVWSGYPTPWLAMAILSGVFSAGAMVILTLRSRHRTLEPRVFHLGQIVIFASVFLFVAATGGLASPVLVLFVLIGSLIDLPYPTPPKPRFSTLAILSIALLFVMPRDWLGPPIAPESFSMILATTSIGATITVTLGLHHGWARAHIDAGQNLERLRDEVLNESTGRARRLEAISSKVAHELKNPLASIKGMAQLVLRSVEDERAKTRLAVVVEEAARMEVILAEYLSFARPLEDLRPQRVEVRSLLEEIVAIFEARAMNARIALSLSGEAAAIVADPRRIKEAMMNLVSNAIQATPWDGSVDIELVKDDLGIAISIRDTGAGMSADTLAKLGTPFFTTRETGTGLGVVLARSAIHQHGGEVRYESKLDQGTTVTVRLPREPKGAPDGSSIAG